MTPEEWNRQSASWKHVHLDAVDAEGAYFEQPHIVYWRRQQVRSWEEDVYALHSIATAYTAAWRKMGYRIPKGIKGVTDATM